MHAGCEPRAHPIDDASQVRLEGVRPRELVNSTNAGAELSRRQRVPLDEQLSDGVDDLLAEV
jgi:hypothetical protein